MMVELPCRTRVLARSSVRGEDAVPSCSVQQWSCWSPTQPCELLPMPTQARMLGQFEFTNPKEYELTAFTVRIVVRGYETDSQGHLNGTIYLQYAEHACWSLLQEAGIAQRDLLARGVGPVILETTIGYHNELLAGDEVEVSCEYLWGTGKSFRIQQLFTTLDGAVVAKVSHVGGILDLAERRLVADPAARYRAIAKKPELLGL
ncbi:acyl-CoA thioesterase [Nocardia sp. NPDC101769]|uniref:acyl-CoA thioesterase n=1 Tax=Nocardia sp. NPDC101769 TaxID=3364333 RepID=UPI00380623CD